MTARALAVLTAASCITFAVSAGAAPPEPNGPHPRLWLDAKTLAVVRAQAQKPGSAVARAIRECERVGADLQADRKNGYMFFEWGAHASNCAIAYQATGRSAYAATGLHFFAAMLDDWEYVGDGKGGDTAARHDDGYAIRAVGVHSAIAYDFFHDAPGMTPALRAKARQRFKAWNDWYWPSGYRSKYPGNNYHAGYLFAVTLMAIAEAGEGGADSASLWRHVTDQVWGSDMKAASAPGGILEGGDWGEGWQYGPLSIVGYSLAARAMITIGQPLPDMERWEEQVVRRYVYGLLPDGRHTWAGGDTEKETPSLAPAAWTMLGVLGGPSKEPATGWARAEVDALHTPTDDKAFLIFDVLAETRNIAPVPFPRETSPTFYVSRGNGTLYARSSWSAGASWMAMQCAPSIPVDHLPANAGNFVLTRGEDELVVDPSPYGSLSSLTSNAPTVESFRLPENYRPSQGYWSKNTGYAWARQTASAIVAARCDYADHFTLQDQPSDVPFARRDLVLVPSEHGDATAIVVDHAHTGAAARALYLRFRTQAGLTLDAAGAHGTLGHSQLSVVPVFESSGTPTVKKTPAGDCFAKGISRGGCTAARFPVNDYGLTVNGEDALAIHVIDVAEGSEKLTAPKLETTPDARVISVERGKRHATIVLPKTEKDALSYRAPPGHHVVLDVSRTGHATVSAKRDGALCAVTVSVSDKGLDAKPLAFVLSDACAATEDPTQTRPVSSDIDPVTRRVAPPPPPDLFPPPEPEPSGPPPVPPSGCGCEVTPTGRSAAPWIAGLALGLLFRRRARR